MTEPNPYHDIRSDFFRKWFETGLDYESYLAASDEKHASRWRQSLERVQLNDSQLATVSKFTRELNLLVLSGVWCGDCSRQGPMLRRIELANPKIKLRLVENKPHPELQNELRINGAEKVPVVVALSEDFFEISRFGDKHLSVYRLKAERELGAACDPGILPPAGEELAAELTEWVQHLERAQYILRLAPMLRRRYED